MKDRPASFGIKSLKIGQYNPETGLYTEVDYPTSSQGLDWVYSEQEGTVIHVANVPTLAVVSVTRMTAREFRRFQRLLLPAWYRQIIRRRQRNGQWRKRR